MNNCKVKLLREGAKLPVRATATAAGYDICFLPLTKLSEKVSYELSKGVVYGLHTGLAFEMSSDVAMLVLPRSGLATKKNASPC